MTRLDTTAARKLWFAPQDWGRPETWLPALSQYVNAVDPDGDTCLCVDVCAPGALDLLAAACGRLGGERRFAEVLAVSEPPADPIAAGCEPWAPAAPAPDLSDPAAAMERVREAKLLCDELRDLEERRRFLAAPDPFRPGAPAPQVSVRIPTWGGTEPLMTRTLPSVLQGGYAHLEVVVCSDGPDPAARAAVEAHPDPRVRFLELPERPAYPVHPHNMWRVGGIAAVNAALDAARGDVIAPLDHDDAFTYGHIPELLGALARGADLVYGQAMSEMREGPWQIIGSAPLRHGHICHGSAMYTSRLAHVRLDAEAWLVHEPGDWNVWRRMANLGARVGFVEHPVLIHFREQTALGKEAGTIRAVTEPTPAEALADVLATPARALLDVALTPVAVAA
jgi:hypothetical protein